MCALTIPPYRGQKDVFLIGFLSSSYDESLPILLILCYLKLETFGPVMRDRWKDVLKFLYWYLKPGKNK